MPPFVLADSDDEGDELTFDGDDKQQSHAPGNDDVPALDGTNEQSTGSTERLRNQIRSAERGLFAESPAKMVSNASVAKSSGPPAVQANKRRHTAALSSEAATNPERRVKRTKTLKTYGNKRSSALAADDESAFAGLRDEGQIPKTSQPARFTEHSGAAKSSALPAGSIQADFINHEPNELFRTTGSTVVDNESSQQRMYERALSDQKGLSTSAVKLAESDEHKSSSFPWSASEQTPSTGKRAAEKVQPEPADKSEMNSEQVQPQLVPGQEVVTEPLDVGRKQSDHSAMPEERSWKEILDAVRQASAAPPNVTSRTRSSPVVEVPSEPVQTKSPAALAATSEPKSTRGRKRKVQDIVTDPPNSDDVAIGLPKERYQPRPSRRRATQMVEEPIDFSVRPEKAAKAKRAKTTTTATQSWREESVIDDHVATKESTDDAQTPHQKLQLQAHDDPQQHDTIAKTGREASDHGTDSANSTPMRKAQAKESSSQRLSRVEVDEIFVKPTPKTKSSSKAKRSHTTIFEDHVDFAGSQRSPNLSQQQARRKSALKGAKTETTQTSQKKRRKVVDDDDEEQDELALDSPDGDDGTIKELAEQSQDQPDSPPKKRGRGRPPKPAPIKAKSFEKVLDDCEAEHESDPEHGEADEEEVPKKKGRGRPPKAAAAAKAKETQQVAKSIEPTTQPTSQKQPLQGISNTATSPTKPKATPPGLQAPTPSPEKPAEGKKDVATPQKKMASPTTHSPLKSSSKVPLRVGLSKRQRIQPLLRTMKPPKR